MVRSLSLTEAGLRQLRQISPKRAQRVSAHALAPENGHGNWKKTLRLHCGAACLLAAMKLDAVWQPGKQKAAALGDRLTYYTAYELTSKYGWDNKGARLSGILIGRYKYYPLYYLGDSNLLWSQEAEQTFLDRVELSPIGNGRLCAGSIFLGEKWNLLEKLMAYAVNPRSRLIHFGRDSSFYYFAMDEIGMRLINLTLDEMALFRFQQRLQQNGICKVSQFPLYLASMEELSEAYVLRTGKRERNELSSGALFACQMEVVKRICEVGPRLVTIPDRWLLDFDMMGKFAQNVSPTANDTALEKMGDGCSNEW